MSGCKRIRIGELGPDHAVIEVDGVDVAGAVQSFSLTASVGNAPRLTLELSALPAECDAIGLVRLAQHQHDALVSLGWTPPTSDLEAVHDGRD